MTEEDRYLQAQYAEKAAAQAMYENKNCDNSGAARGGMLGSTIPGPTSAPRPHLWDDPRGWAHDITAHHSPTRDGLQRIAAIRSATEHLINEILRSCPDCGDRSNAIANARCAMMFANAAIALDGRV